MTRAYAIGAAVLTVVFLVVIGLFVARPAWLAGLTGGSDDPFAPCRQTVVQGGLSSIGGPFTLVNSQGQTVTDQDVLTMPSLVYFGYTFCPDVCPLDNARNALATEILESNGIMIQPVFISIDPNRDTPEVVGEFAAIFHPRLLGPPFGVFAETPHEPAQALLLGAGCIVESDDLVHPRRLAGVSHLFRAAGLRRPRLLPGGSLDVQLPGSARARHGRGVPP